MSAHFPRAFPRALPAIRAPLGRKPYKMDQKREGRLIPLRRIVTELFEEERIETLQYKAFEARPYAERLIQLAIHYGDKHKPTMEICDFWLENKDLVPKLFKVLVPRFQNYKTSYTRVFKLPEEYQKVILPTKRERYYSTKSTILELKGNPFPPVVPEPINHKHSLLNVLLREAKLARRSQNSSNHST